jgi:hypothetical protein
MKEKSAAEQGSEITATTAHQQTKHISSLSYAHTAKIINLLYWYGMHTGTVLLYSTLGL